MNRYEVIASGNSEKGLRSYIRELFVFLTARAAGLKTLEAEGVDMLLTLNAP